jgi:hypothetical protein
MYSALTLGMTGRLPSGLGIPCRNPENFENCSKLHYDRPPYLNEQRLCFPCRFQLPFALHMGGRSAGEVEGGDDPCFPKNLPSRLPRAPQHMHSLDSRRTPGVFSDFIQSTHLKDCADLEYHMKPDL